MIKINCIEDYLKEITRIAKEKNIKLFIYRGQPNSSWDVQSSAARRLLKSLESDSFFIESFIKYHVRLLDNAKLKGYHQKEKKELTDLELIAELQHYSAATCLIDFSRNPLVALWFASYGNLEVDGAVFLLNLGDPEKFSQITFNHVQNWSIDKLLNENKLWYWEPSDLNLRIPKQHSIFIFGKPVLDVDLFNIILINKDSKKEILKELERIYNITQTTLFSDLPGYARANSIEVSFLQLEAEDYKLYGIYFMQQNEYEKALDNFNRSIELNSNDSELFTLRGLTQFNLGKMENAISDYNQSILIKPESNQAYIGRGMAYIAINEYNKAIEDIDKFIEFFPESYVAFQQKGLAHRGLKEYEKAVLDFTQAIQLEPDFWQLYESRGLTFVLINNLDSALKDYNRAIELNPYIPKLFKCRAHIKRSLGLDYDAIIDDQMADKLEKRVKGN